MPGWRQSRQQAGAAQNDNGKSERDRIARFKTKQQRRGELRRPHARGGPDYHARRDHQTDATEDEANDAAWSCTESHANSDLPAAAADRICRDAKKAESSQENRETAKEPRQQRESALLSQRRVDLLGQGVKSKGGIGIDGSYCSGNAPRHLLRRGRFRADRECQRCGRLGLQLGQWEVDGSAPQQSGWWLVIGRRGSEGQ